MGERRTPLLDLHRQLGAKLTDFAGWEMPLQYTGIVAEHNAVRTACGIFDVSHLGKLRLTGGTAEDVIQNSVTADVSRLEIGRATYALVLTDDAGCIDDIFVYRLGEDEWLLVPNAANVGAVADAVRSSGGDPLDEWDRWAILALQGPQSFEIFASIFPGAEVDDLPLHGWTSHDYWGETGFVARTGYTGERGYEMYVPAAAAERTMNAFMDAGVVPCGLGARDTLRLEMGYALYGHEIDLDTDPLEAGLGWAVKWDAPFRGRDALLKIKEEGPARKLFGLTCTGRGVPRQGYGVYRGDDLVGEIVSGNFSPTLGTGIALAYAPSDRVPAIGDKVEVDARGRRIGADIVKPPFIERGK
ncbi:MAG: glycine cleavage system aminomethyltransferase GcvT [Actinomycetota bacterium]